MELKDLIRKYALQNAAKFNGKAEENAVIKKLFAEDSGLKTKIKEIRKEVQEAISRISRLSAEEQTEFKKLAQEAKKKESKRELP